MKVKIEEYHPLNVSSSGLSYSYPLIHTFNAVELVGETVTLAHLLNTDSQTGAIFSWTRHTYVPYFALSNRSSPIQGKSFQELISNFPFGTFSITGEWLLFELHSPDGQTERYEREIKDRIGFQNRQTGGHLALSFDAQSVPLLINTDQFVTVFGHSNYTADKITSLSLTGSHLGAKLQNIQQQLGDLSNLSAAMLQSDLYQEGINLQNQVFQSAGHMLGASYYNIVDEIAQESAEGMLSSLYPSMPRLVLISTQVQDEGMATIAIDLLRTNVRTTAAPGQAAYTTTGLQFLYGVLSTEVEGFILEGMRELSNANGHTAISINVSKIMNNAEESGIPLIVLSPDTSADLAPLTISTEAKARIADALTNNKVIIVPETMVEVDGELTIGWYEIDIASGAFTSVGENGLHQGLLARAYKHIFQSGPINALSFFGGLLAGTLASQAAFPHC